MASPGKRNLAKSTESSPDADELRALHAGLFLLRAADEAATSLAQAGKTGLHVSCKGLEAVLGGVAAALLPSDWVLPGVRQSSIALARGLNPISWLAQRLGRIADPARGRQEPGHLSAKSLNVVSVSTRPGSQFTHAAGVGRAMAGAGRNQVAVALCGQGAVAGDDFHTGLNFAAVWDAPTVFVVDSSEGLATQTASEGIAIKAVAYGMPGHEVDGGDVIAVHQAMREALAQARMGNGPTLIEARTPLPPGAGAPAPLHLVSEEGEDSWGDPLERFAAELADGKVLDQAAGSVLRGHFDELMAEATSSALRLAPVPPETLLSDVFATPTPALQHQLEEWRAAALGEDRC